MTQISPTFQVLKCLQDNRCLYNGKGMVFRIFLGLKQGEQELQGFEHWSMQRFIKRRAERKMSQWYMTDKGLEELQ